MVFLFYFVNNTVDFVDLKFFNVKQFLQPFIYLNSRNKIKEHTFGKCFTN